LRGGAFRGEEDGTGASERRRRLVSAGALPVALSGNLQSTIRNLQSTTASSVIVVSLRFRSPLLACKHSKALLLQAYDVDTGDTAPEAQATCLIRTPRAGRPRSRGNPTGIHAKAWFKTCGLRLTVWRGSVEGPGPSTPSPVVPCRGELSRGFEPCLRRWFTPPTAPVHQSTARRYPSPPAPGPAWSCPRPRRAAAQSRAARSRCAGR